MTERIYKLLQQKINANQIFLNEPMSKHTTFKIGGPAEIFIKIKTIEELQYIIKIAKQENIQLTVIGNGSNILVLDKGIKGIVIKICLDEIKVEDDEIYVQSGTLLSKVCNVAYRNSLSGLEFAFGIPGSIGGAVKMNAGAYGGEMKDIVIETTYIDNDLNIKTITNEKHEFKYRHSIFSDNNHIILDTKLKLKKDIHEKIKERMDANSSNRKEKQPIEYPSAGSVFKRGDNYITAQLIDNLGLKGYNIGDAYISEKHAGFIINKNQATAEEVMKLIDYIKLKVYEKYNVNLNLEIEILGE